MLKKFNFIYIALGILFLLSTNTNGLFNIKTLSAAPNNEEYQKLLSYTDNETPLRIPPCGSYLGQYLISPADGSYDCPVYGISFSWRQYKETTKYKLTLSKDQAMTQVIKEAEVTDNNYQYDGRLGYSTRYFWRVMSIEPAPSDWSAPFTFLTAAAPPSPPEASPQPTLLPTTPIVIMLVILSAAVGLITWLVIAQRHRAK